MHLKLCGMPPTGRPARGKGRLNWGSRHKAICLVTHQSEYCASRSNRWKDSSAPACSSTSSCDEVDPIPDYENIHTD
jgi:hypothetical protein